MNGFEEIQDEYYIEITVPIAFPRLIPKVVEVGGRISRRYHTNPDHTLCLGSDMRQMLLLVKEPTLHGFTKNILLPYLYAHSFYKKNGRMPFGELPHGNDGLIEDFADVFDVNKSIAKEMVRLASLKKRYSSQLPPPEVVA